MRLFISLLFLITVSLSGLADDILLTRSGAEFKGKLELISEKEVSFLVKSGGLLKSKSSRVFPIEEIYMIKTDKRGTTFFNRKRERSTGPSQQLPKNADILYLADGGEIPVWNISMENGMITFDKSSKQKKALSEKGFYATSEVFMVKYTDGSKDLFTDISVPPTPPANNNKEQSEEEIKLKVTMYTVEKGDTYGSIAQKFHVSIAEIVSWNDLPQKTNASARPTPGDQLMIQEIIR